MFDRYAIYYTPEGALADAGAAWLGWDSATGMSKTHPEVGGLDIAKLTETPRKYGFHGTIKPPFFLAQGHTAKGLRDATKSLAAQLAPVTLDGLEATRLGGFIALTPLGDTAALAQMAARVVKELDPFRTPPSEAELARRRKTPLSPLHEKNLNDWGYPYVMEAFRFHMTLTRRVAEADAILPPIADHFAPVLPKPFVIRDITLLGQKSDGLFYQIERYPLTGDLQKT